jgi:hypothetical protein
VRVAGEREASTRSPPTICFCTARPTVSPAPAMTRNSPTAWQPIIEASCTISLVRMSRSLSAITSSKAKLSIRSMSSGSVWVSTLVQLNLPVGRTSRRTVRFGGLRLLECYVVLDGDPVGAFAGSEPAATRISRAAMAGRLRRPYEPSGRLSPYRWTSRT